MAAQEELSREATDRIVVHKLGVAQVGEILELEGMCFSYRWNREQFARGLAAGVFHVQGARRGTVLVGYLAYSMVSEEMEILNLAVRPEARRAGVASKLLHSMLCDCRTNGVQQGFLEVKESNAPAIDLYRKFGFNQVGRRKKYYPDTGEDALVLRLDLPPDQ